MLFSIDVIYCNATLFFIKLYILQKKEFVIITYDASKIGKWLYYEIRKNCFLFSSHVILGSLLNLHCCPENLLVCAADT